jgi:hypothetical protein
MADLGDAKFVYIKYEDRGRTIHDEVLCRKHFEQRKKGGAFDPVTKTEQIKIQPWGGEDRCSVCEDNGI